MTASCPGNGNYSATTNVSAGDFTINQATPTAYITNSPQVSTGSPLTATVACSGGGAATLASGGTGTVAGAYPAIVNCAASMNYSAAAGLPAGDFVIVDQTVVTLGDTDWLYYDDNRHVDTGSRLCIRSGRTAAWAWQCSLRGWPGEWDGVAQGPVHHAVCEYEACRY